MGRSNTRYRNIMEEAENTDTVQQDEIIMGSYLPKGLNEESRKQGRYHRIWSLSDCLCF